MELLDKAIIFAVHAHEGQLRKMSKTPYIIHPMEVLTIADTITKDEEVLCAAVLHDTVEDTAVDIEDIRQNFGDRVYRLVATETENKRKGTDPKSTWRIRKEESLQALENSSDIGTKVIWLSDKLANARSFYRMYAVIGNEVWAKTNTSNPKDHEWYYRRVLELVSELKNTTAYQEYERYVELLFPNQEKL